MEIFTWILIFVVSLAALVKGSHWFLHGAERLGIRLGFSPFVIGALIVGIGTSLPELVSAFAAIIQGVPEVVVANATGSNIANILLILGIIAIMGRRLEVTRSLIDLELPLFAISTVLFLGIVYDGQVLQIESILLFITYLIYFVYSLAGGEKKASTVVAEKSKELQKFAEREYWGLIYVLRRVAHFKDQILFVAGLCAVLLGAKYLIESVIELSTLLDIAPGLISISAIAIGTSLPELAVSGRAVLQGKSEVAVGNILGSNSFNALFVVGLPGLFGSLSVDHSTLSIGVPIMALATFLFIIVGISRRIYHWEGMMFLVLYVFFILKIFSII
ncbi:calcium/sodium antiporter [Patescibacteria group bacterium]